MLVLRRADDTTCFGVSFAVVGGGDGGNAVAAVVVVHSVKPGGVADQAGIAANRRVVAINGSACSGMTGAGGTDHHHPGPSTAATRVAAALAKAPNTLELELELELDLDLGHQDAAQDTDAVFPATPLRAATTPPSTPTNAPMSTPLGTPAEEDKVAHSTPVKGGTTQDKSPRSGVFGGLLSPQPTVSPSCTAPHRASRCVVGETQFVCLRACVCASFAVHTAGQRAVCVW